MARRPVEPLDAHAARRSALDTLARRDLPSGGLRRKLLEAGYDDSVVAPLIERLSAEKLLNDRRFVENFIAYHAERGQGPVRLRLQLHKLELEDGLVEECLGDYCDWIAQLRKARARKFGASIPSGYAERQRQLRFLSYRGFTSAQIRSALGFDIDLERDDPSDMDDL